MRRRFEPGNFKLQVRRSKTGGRGMFALESIPRGSCIIEYTGRPLSEKEQDKDGKYFFWTSSKTMIDGNIPSNKARFINHSCAPNCEVELKNKRIYVFTLRMIKPGEELNYDYDTEYWEAHIKPKGCLCSKCVQKREKAAAKATITSRTRVSA
ncbi:MAG: SET domain-containing protein [Candidatus Pacebacteria bacterium]|nr:SET domain-containing protein [Candidatus Paceibacterota bacterium]